jgi:hypothetical protein
MPAGHHPAPQAVADGTINLSPVRQSAPPVTRPSSNHAGHRTQQHAAGRSRLNADKQSYRVAASGEPPILVRRYPTYRYSRTDRTSLRYLTVIDRFQSNRPVETRRWK